MCLALGPQRSDAGEARTRGPSVWSQALYHCAPFIGDLSSPVEDVLKEATDFITACYKMWTDGSDMSSVRQNVWASRVGKASSCAPKLCSLPPTSEAFRENVKSPSSDMHLETRYSY